MSTVAIVYGIILSTIIVLFIVGVSRYIHKWKECVAKLNHIEEELSDLMLHHGK
ncbi:MULTISPECIES: peptidase [Bacillus]|uniref:Peptidase n=2 Tax=Bacillus cereus group TaxID=86661 RepID=A0A2A7D1Y3_BACAN|nr:MULTISPECIES: peptidase [Bacillus]MCP1163051.1 peptidase [Bacillus sp. 1813sda1]MDC7976564.1 peptidase [Bacillus sp. BLCC-B18]OTW68304.1 peptidase [Bacillus thuringiensis serovar coreanensis]OTX44921.1 peptidase [Bacillus thuringiensis serovar sooncheon]OTX54084.1 peptidase [Bacillus thuringiensis serovar guiyangiensis]